MVFGALKEKNIFRNQKRIRKNVMLSPKDTISLFFPFEKLDFVPADFMPLSILYEDAHLLIVNKPAFLTMHPTKEDTAQTLANLVAHYFLKHQIQFKVRFINRLDRDTSGVVMIAKNPFAHQQYQQKSDTGKLQKQYLALVSGEHKLTQGIFREDILVRDKKKPSATAYELLSKKENISLFKVTLKTGRTHQIRIHFAQAGLPLIGDGYHGGDTALAPRQLLHAFCISTPCLSEDKNLNLWAPLPEDMNLFLKNKGLEIPSFVV